MSAPTTLQMAPNVPITMTIKYVDVWPNDTSKNNGKGYGPSLALRGTVDGQDCRVYPKGFLDRNLQRLMQADVIELGSYATDPEAKYSIPVNDGEDIQLELEQPAGEKYPAFVARNPKLFAIAPKPGRETPRPSPSDDGYLNALVGDPPGNVGSGTVARGPQIPLLVPNDARMTNCFGSAITIIRDAEQLSGKLATFEDIRSTAISLYIQGAGR